MSNTRAMITKANGAARIRAFLNALSLKPIRRARNMGACSLCACPIHPGEDYRGETGRRAHEFCFQAVNKEFTKRGK